MAGRQLNEPITALPFTIARFTIARFTIARCDCINTSRAEGQDQRIYSDTNRLPEGWGPGSRDADIT